MEALFVRKRFSRMTERKKMNEKNHWAESWMRDALTSAEVSGLRRTRSLVSGLVIAAVVLLSGASQAKTMSTIEKHADQVDAWDVARVTQIEPLSAMLHHPYPDLIEERDLETLLRFYATGTGRRVGLGEF